MVVPELWAWVAAYDHVALCQLWGDMTELPQSMPRYTRELRQFWEDNAVLPSRRRPPTHTTHLPTPGTTS